MHERPCSASPLNPSMRTLTYISLLCLFACTTHPTHTPVFTISIEVARGSKQGEDGARATLKELLFELCKDVEELTGLNFQADPVLRFPGDGAWIELMKRELPPGKDLIRRASFTWGVYLPEEHEVAISPFIGHHLVRQAEATGKERKRTAVDFAAHKAILVHELTHILQQEHYGLPKAMRAEDERKAKFVLKSLVEGHAFMIEEMAAEQRYGIEDYYKMVYPQKRRYQAYLAGRNYMLHIFARDGMGGVRAQLENPPEHAEFMKLAYKRLPKRKQ